MALSLEDRRNLRVFLAEHFSLSELKNLAFDLGLPVGDIPHETESDYARELILFCERIGQVGSLLERVNSQRPADIIAVMLAKVQPLAAVQESHKERQLQQTEERRNHIHRVIGSNTSARSIIQGLLLLGQQASTEKWSEPEYEDLRREIHVRQEAADFEHSILAELSALASTQSQFSETLETVAQFETFEKPESNNPFVLIAQAICTTDEVAGQVAEAAIQATHQMVGRHKIGPEVFEFGAQVLVWLKDHGHHERVKTGLSSDPMLRSLASHPELREFQLQPQQYDFPGPVLDLGHWETAMQRPMAFSGSQYEQWLRINELKSMPFGIQDEDLQNPSRSFDDPASIPGLRDDSCRLLTSNSVTDRQIIVSTLARGNQPTVRRLMVTIDLPHGLVPVPMTGVSTSRPKPPDVPDENGGPDALHTARLRNVLDSRMDWQDLETFLLPGLKAKLADRLGEDVNRLDSDNLPGATKLKKLQSLIDFLKRRKLLPSLLQWIQQNRPDIEVEEVMSHPRASRPGASQAAVVPCPAPDDVIRLIAREMGKSWIRFLSRNPEALFHLPRSERASVVGHLVWATGSLDALLAELDTRDMRSKPEFAKAIEEGLVRDYTRSARMILPTPDVLLTWLARRPDGAAKTWVIAHCVDDRPRAIGQALTCWSLASNLQQAGIGLKLIGPQALAQHLEDNGLDNDTPINWDDKTLASTLDRLVKRASATSPDDADFAKLFRNSDMVEAAQEHIRRFARGSLSRQVAVCQAMTQVLLERVTEQARARATGDRDLRDRDYQYTPKDVSKAVERLEQSDNNAVV